MDYIMNIVSSYPSDNYCNTEDIIHGIGRSKWICKLANIRIIYKMYR